MKERGTEVTRLSISEVYRAILILGKFITPVKQERTQKDCDSTPKQTSESQHGDDIELNFKLDDEAILGVKIQDNSCFGDAKFEVLLKDKEEKKVNLYDHLYVQLKKREKILYLGMPSYDVDRSKTRGFFTNLWRKFWNRNSYFELQRPSYQLFATTLESIMNECSDDNYTIVIPITEVGRTVIGTDRAHLISLTIVKNGDNVDVRIYDPKFKPWLIFIQNCFYSLNSVKKTVKSLFEKKDSNLKVRFSFISGKQGIFNDVECGWHVIIDSVKTLTGDDCDFEKVQNVLKPHNVNETKNNNLVEGKKDVGNFQDLDQILTNCNITNVSNNSSISLGRGVG